MVKYGKSGIKQPGSWKRRRLVQTTKVTLRQVPTNQMVWGALLPGAPVVSQGNVTRLAHQSCDSPVRWEWER